MEKLRQAKAAAKRSNAQPVAATVAATTAGKKGGRPKHSEEEKKAAAEKKKSDRKVREQKKAADADTELLESTKTANKEDEDLRKDCVEIVNRMAENLEIDLDAPATMTVQEILRAARTNPKEKESKDSNGADDSDDADDVDDAGDLILENMFLSSKTFIAAITEKYRQSKLVMVPKEKAPFSMVARKQPRATTEACKFANGKFIWRDILMDISETLSRAVRFMERQSRIIRALRTNGHSPTRFCIWL